MRSFAGALVRRATTRVLDVLFLLGLFVTWWREA